ncbi:MAG: nitroreductase [Acidimicrobiales bacterium]|nr:MAG: nitroreductase [Acidimicrobiales bacterium]
MDLDQVIARRRMVRNFADRAVPPELVDRLLERATHAPSAGFTQGWAFLVLEGPGQTAVFWEATSDREWRQADPAVMRAPVVVIPLTCPGNYFDRYAEPDKAQPDQAQPDQAAAGLGDPRSWAVPYWLVDAAFATMLILLGATDAGLGALFFRLHRSTEELLGGLGVPEGWVPIGAIALGWPAPDRASPSLARGRRPLDEVVHRGRW